MCFIGSSFGDVYVALNKVSNELVAVKRIPLPPNAGPLNEPELLKSCQSGFVVRYYDVVRKDNEIWVCICDLCDKQIVMEFCRCGSIGAYIQSEKRLSKEVLRDIVSCILLGLSYLHNKKVIHRVSAKVIAEQ